MFSFKIIIASFSLELSRQAANEQSSVYSRNLKEQAIAVDSRPPKFDRFYSCPVTRCEWITKYLKIHKIAYHILSTVAQQQPQKFIWRLDVLHETRKISTTDSDKMIGSFGNIKTNEKFCKQSMKHFNFHFCSIHEYSRIKLLLREGSFRQTAFQESSTQNRNSS